MGRTERAFRVEVVYATRELQLLLPLEVDHGTTAGEAIERSGIMRRIPDGVLDGFKVGIFGRLVSADTVLRQGDRVEIYRALVADPKQARRTRGRTLR